MSIVSLLSDKEKNNIMRLQHIEIISPQMTALKQIKPENKVKLIKVCNFANVKEEIYFVATVLTGAIIEGMTANYKGKTIEILEVESKLGNVAKTGMQTGILVSGVTKEEVDQNAEIVFSKVE